MFGRLSAYRSFVRDELPCATMLKHYGLLPGVAMSQHWLLLSECLACYIAVVGFVRGALLLITYV